MNLAFIDNIACAFFLQKLTLKTRISARNLKESLIIFLAQVHSYVAQNQSMDNIMA